MKRILMMAAAVVCVWPSVTTAAETEEVKERVRVVKPARQRLVAARPAIMSIVVGGEVNKPGIYQVPHWATLFDALAEAGWINTKASTQRIKVIRTQADGKISVLEYKLKEILQEGSTLPKLQPKDRIYVSESTW